MTIDDFQELVTETLESTGVRVLKVSIGNTFGPHELEFRRLGEGRYEVSPAFLLLPKEEARFGILHLSTPPGSLYGLGFISQVVYAIVLGVLLIRFGMGQMENPLVLFFVIPMAYLGLNSYLDQCKNKANRLGKSIAICGDPISARTFLEKKHGPLIPAGIIPTLGRRFGHPIRNYLRFGEDKRIKAFLHSDLTHPTSDQQYDKARRP